MYLDDRLSHPFMGDSNQQESVLVTEPNFELPPHSDLKNELIQNLKSWFQSMTLEVGVLRGKQATMPKATRKKKKNFSFLIIDLD